MLFRLRPPLAANSRVEDLLKRASTGCVAEYYRPKLRSIQVSPAQKDFVAKSPSNFLFHLWKLDKSVRCLIGVEEFRCGNDLAETFAKRAFTRGNPSGDSDGRHSSED